MLVKLVLNCDEVISKATRLTLDDMANGVGTVPVVSLTAMDRTLISRPKGSVALLVATVAPVTLKAFLRALRLVFAILVSNPALEVLNVA